MLSRLSRSQSHRTILLAAAVALVGLSACSVDDALRPSAPVGFAPAGLGPVGPAPVAPGNFGYAIPSPELIEPQPVPAEEIACRQRLRRLGVTFEDIPPIRGGGGCGIEHPVKVSGLPGKVQLKPAATLTCAMAEAFALWTRDELNPASRRRYFSGVATIHQGSSYSCRTIGNRRGGTLSEHARGNAIDVMKLTLRNGREIDVRKPGLFSFRQRSLLNSVRGDACGYFSTVLGPGYNYDHRDHFHFDLKPRRNGRRACH